MNKTKTAEMPTMGEEIITIHESKHFPFQIIEKTTTNEKEENKDFKIAALGAFMTHQVFKTKAEAEKYISKRPWELITNLICATIQNAFEYEKSKSNN